MRLPIPTAYPARKSWCESAKSRSKVKACSSHLPGMMAGWTGARDLASVPKESFRDWWAKR